MRVPSRSSRPEPAGGPAAELARPRVVRAPLRGNPLVGRLLLVIQITLLLAMTATVATKVWQDHIWFGFVLVGATVAVWLPELTRPRARRWWFAYVGGIFLYTLLRAYADETGMPIQTSYVIDFDHLVFFGNDPVVWLQGHLFSTTHVSALDFFAVQVHWSFFIAPHLAAVLIFIWRRDLFPRYTILVVGTMYAGLVLFFLVPTAPPWMAARDGALPEAFRIMDFVGGKVNANTYQAFSASLAEPNSVAAMPSIHMAVTFGMYLWARDNRSRWAPWLLGYSLIMGAALVYLAEHYVLDLIAGVVVALLVNQASRRFGDVPALLPATSRRR